MEDFTAEYKPTGTPESKAVKVEKLMPVFRSLAKTFEINVAIDCPDKPVDLAEYFELGRVQEVFFHLDTYPAKYNLVNTVNIYSLFYLNPKQPILVKVASLEKGISPYSLPKTNLISPEGTIIGCILGSHVFIYPNTLTNEAWTEEERKIILNLIAYWFMPRAIVNILPNHRNHIEVGLNNLRSGYRNLHLINSDRKEESKKIFAAFIAKVNAELTIVTEERIAEVQKNIEETTKKYFESLMKNIQNKEQLESVRSEMLNRDFGREFESLLNMESVETVRVEENRYLLIKTSPIFQIPAINRETGNSESYDIGEYVVAIDTVWPESILPSRSSIRFRQDIYRGPFEHAYLKDMADTCFGNANQADNMGLNPAINNLISRFEIVPLVHLLITFMKKEKTKPSKRLSWNNSIKPVTDFYVSKEERTQIKELFISLLSKTVSKLSVDQLEKKVRELDQEIDSLYQALIMAKADLDDQEEMLERINNFVFDTVEIKREANFIFNDLSIFWADLSPGCLAIYFYQRRMNSLGQEYIPEDYVLKIKNDSFPELLIQTPKKCFQTIPLIDPNRLKTGELKDGDETLIKNLRLGKISEVLAIVKNKICAGAFDPKNKNPEVKNDK